ncbi:serine/threonine-protein phosphatase 2A 55 kDa regulatory subunit B beta isoform isoform X2 [Lates japonicus]|uniref:Serine/threonine-protein phosphatase 2A 55 kDa regulatory subunit B beta isoform isoform X2 n=1 Tax=Lates japonicus TaxID=270547 RepID=A0AAD3MI76_LATJO|nr:serine/threonine-protein phosphatase 2A 55 kDa regulatory subunit B beta isoform isoform X2 [Lates japonicus]
MALQDLPDLRGNLLLGHKAAVGFTRTNMAPRWSHSPPADGTRAGWEQVCRFQDPEPADLSMEEESDTRKINNSFLRDHNYATEADIISTREQESKSQPQRRGEYNVYSTFQSHEPEFDYLKSLEIEEKINKIKWLPQQNAAYFLLSTNDKTVKLWKISERDKRPEGYNLKDEDGRIRDPSTITSLRISAVFSVSVPLCLAGQGIIATCRTGRDCGNPV